MNVTEKTGRNTRNKRRAVLGIDIGSTAVHAALIYSNGDETSRAPNAREVEPAAHGSRPTRGRPLNVLAQVLEEDIFSESNPRTGEILEQCRGVVHCAVTGFSGDLFANRIPAERINEVLAVSTAIRRFHPKTRSILDLGGQFTKFIKLGRSEEEGLVVDCALNGLCAAGSGAFLEQQATRLKMSIRELAQAAANAERGATIAGRCSVFAKSDMIHLQQKGAPVEEIAYGLCLALVRTFTSTVLGHRTVDPPVAFAGGGSANPGLLRAFRSVLDLEDSQVIVDPLHGVFGAIGAALLEQSAPAVRVEALLKDLSAPGNSFSASTLSSGSGSSSPFSTPDEPSEFSTSSIHPPFSSSSQDSGLTMQPGATGEPATGSAVLENTGGHEPLDISFVKRDRDGVVTEDPGCEVLPESEEIPAVLGIDVGSVSTNIAVLSPDDELYLGIYLPTRGRPVDVLAEGMAIVRERFGDRIRVITSGATGSGRHLAGRVLGLDVVHNEITAQMVSASAYEPDVDTIFEIGGQDSKYIGARGGNLDAFEMNKICSAGTGSFLEEQAEQLGVKIIGEFAERAFRSKRPHDLGSHCTVFMDTEIVRAKQAGAEVDDLCAGLAYSIAKNYLDRVVAGRPIGKHIVFSGGTASNEAVVAAFGRILGLPINVHPANRIAGAIGAGLLAKRFLKSHMIRFPGYKSSFRGLDAVKDYTLKSFECSRCPNRCQVNQVIVGDRKAHFGDACERFASRDVYSGEQRSENGKTISGAAFSGPDKLSAREHADLFDLRAELLADHLPPSRPREMNRPRVGLPMASLNLELAPLWTVFLDEMGYEPVLSGPTTPTMMSSGSHGLPSEVCLPLKSAAGHAADLVLGGIERIFLPNVLELPPRNDKDSAHTCLFAQSLSDMLRTLRPSEIWAPHVCLAHAEGINESVREFSALFMKTPEEVRSALEKAIQIQKNFRDNREAIGRKVLGDTDFDRAVIVMGKPYNCHDPYLNLDLSRHLKRLGLKAIPMDMIPLGDIELGSRLNVLPWAYNRDQIRTLQRIEEDPRLYPLVVSNFGCGPDAFTLNHLNELMSHRPHLVLEFDEHRGEAGLVTRLEAFYDEIEQHIRRGRKNKKKRNIVIRSAPKLKKGTCHVPLFCDHSHIFAAVFKGAGMEVKMLPPSDETTVRKAETVGSGKECHPYRLVAGDLVKLVESGLYSEGDVFFIPGTVNPCLMPQYGDAARYLLRSMGETGISVWDPPVHEMASMCGKKRIISFYEGLLATDMLMIASCRFRPYERHPGSIDAVHADNIRLIAHTVEHCGDMGAVMGDCIRRLRQVPMTGRSRLPVVGIAGDIYTRINAIGNANLFRRLEAMGCEVWPHPYFAGYEDFCRYRDTVRSWKREELGSAFYYLLTSGGLQSLANTIAAQLGPDLAAHCIEPSPSRLSELAFPYVGPLANPLLHSNVGKIVDFINRGAAGVINAVGLNCMVGIASDAAVRAIKRDAPLVPVITLVYGGAEGPSQRIRLETFIHQVGGRLSSEQHGGEKDFSKSRDSGFDLVWDNTP